MIKFNKPTLDALGTLFGVVAGISAVLGTFEVVSPRVAGAVGGIASVLLGVVTQKPATATPTTEQVEGNL